MILALLMCMASFVVYGQQAQITENGITYLLHTVAKGQTLYAISKTYSVTVADIQKANPEIQNNGIRINETLRIPVKAIDKKAAKRSEITLVGDTIYHQVLKKETLYALSKKYEVSQEQLLLWNPNLKEGLKVGSTVIIVGTPVAPAAGEDALLAEIYALPKQDSLILHQVAPQETLYGLSKKYGVSADSIQLVNNGLPEGLRVGSTIRIPKPNPAYTGHIKRGNTVRTDSVSTGVDSLKMALFLPFCVEKNKELSGLNLVGFPKDDALLTDGLQENSNFQMYNLTQLSLAYYRGVKIAIDSLVSQGYHITLKVYDTDKNVEQCRYWVNQGVLADVDVVIGPLFGNNFKVIADTAKGLGIPIVSPVKINSAILLNNPFVLKAYSSAPSQIIAGATYYANSFNDSNMVIFSGTKTNDKRYASIFEKYVLEITGDSIPVHKIWSVVPGNFENKLSKDNTNYVAVVSEDEAFVASSLTVLYGLHKKGYVIHVMGTSAWKGFESLDYGYLNALNVTYPVPQYVNYDTSTITPFLHTYREKYFSEPSLQAYFAFDIATYFTQALYHPEGWRTYIHDQPYHGLSARFDWVKIGESGGYENQGSFLVNYRDFELHLVK